MKTKMKQKIKRKCNAMTSMKGKNVTYNKINFLASSHEGIHVNKINESRKCTIFNYYYLLLI